jgi:hypothetical protein
MARCSSFWRTGSPRARPSIKSCALNNARRIQCDRRVEFDAGPAKPGINVATKEIAVGGILGRPSRVSRINDLST